MGFTLPFTRQSDILFIDANFGREEGIEIGMENKGYIRQSYFKEIQGNYR